MKKKTEINSCPFCGSDICKIQEDIHNIGCLSCGAIGPDGDTDSDAIHKWNSVGEYKSLRDYFAGKALSGMCDFETVSTIIESKIAEQSYLLADAMIKAREKSL